MHGTYTIQVRITVTAPKVRLKFRGESWVDWPLKQPFSKALYEPLWLLSKPIQSPYKCQWSNQQWQILTLSTALCYTTCNRFRTVSQMANGIVMWCLSAIILSGTYSYNDTVDYVQWLHAIFFLPFAIFSLSSGKLFWNWKIIAIIHEWVFEV